jgi:hypothetical protein
MDVDTSLELAGDDPSLEIPWSAGDGLQYRDLVAHPELLTEISEAAGFPELAELLRRVNAPNQSFQTVKCDAWASNDIEPAEEIYGAACKHGSYCDLVLRDGLGRFSLNAHEVLVAAIARALRKLPDVSAAIELVIRHCYFWEGADTRRGFAITAFVGGYGDNSAHAQKECGAALLCLSNVLECIDNSPVSP